MIIGPKSREKHITCGGYKMKTKVLLSFPLCLLVITVGCCVDIGGCWEKEKYERTEHLSAPVPAEGILDIETDVGSVNVIGADVTDCNVTATICAKAFTEKEAKELAEQVKLKLEPAGKILTVRVEKPLSRRCKRSISIDFEVTVPKQTGLQLESDVGKIRISDIAGRIEAKTDVGEITCREISGDIDLKTDVGEVEVVYSKTAPAARDVVISTDVGGIDFTAPPDFSAAVDIATDVGAIKTDKPIALMGEISKNRLKGTIGNGEGKLRLTTDVGSIKIR